MQFIENFGISTYKFVVHRKLPCCLTKIQGTEYFPKYSFVK